MLGGGRYFLSLRSSVGCTATPGGGRKAVAVVAFVLVPATMEVTAAAAAAEGR